MIQIIFSELLKETRGLNDQFKGFTLRYICGQQSNRM